MVGRVDPAEDLALDPDRPGGADGLGQHPGGAFGRGRVSLPRPRSGGHWRGQSGGHGDQLDVQSQHPAVAVSWSLFGVVASEYFGVIRGWVSASKVMLRGGATALGRSVASAAVESWGAVRRVDQAGIPAGLAGGVGGRSASGLASWRRRGPGWPRPGSVSYTHLAVYKRQNLASFWHWWRCSY